MERSYHGCRQGSDGGEPVVPLYRDNGIFNSSNTAVVEKVNFVVAASQHGGTSVAEGSP